MQMLTGNLAPSRGAISICGIDLFDAAARRQGAHRLPARGPAALPRADRRRVPHARSEAASRAAGAPRARRSHDAKQRCGLTDAGRKLIGTLSKGYQQRVGIAQAIAARPDVVILDEPTIGLDPNQIREIRALIRELGGAHSVILSTHILPEVEAVCDRVQIMHHGEHRLQRHDRRAEAVPQRRAPCSSGCAARRRVAELAARARRRCRGERGADALPRAVRRRGRRRATRWSSAAAARTGASTSSQPAQTSLEDVFVNLTRREDAVT